METQSAYETVNGAWGCNRREVRKLSGKEAVKACRLLLAEGFRAFGVTKDHRARQKRKFKIVSGRKRTWVRHGVWNVNPDWYGQGLPEIVHAVSHFVHRRVNPGLTHQRGGGHNGHAHVEQHLVEYVINKRWHLDGVPVKEVTMKAKVDLKTKRHASVCKRIKAWETKAKRASTALKKLRQVQKRYERQVP